MKKQMTILAAAAIVASFATAAFAATPTITMTGKFTYGVEYHLVDSAITSSIDANDYWTDNADNSFLTDPAYKINFSVSAPQLGTVSCDLASNGATSGSFGSPVYTNTLGGMTLKLGQVSYDWDGVSNALGGNAGAEVTGSIGTVALDAITGYTGVQAADIVAVRAAAPIGAASKAYGAVVLDPQKHGLGWVGASTTVGVATLEGVYAKEIADDNGSGFRAVATVPVTPALKFTGKVVSAKHELNKFVKVNTADFGMLDLVGNVAANAGYYGGTNLYGKAEYTWATGCVGYAEVTAPFDATVAGVDQVINVGTSYAPLFITDAKVSINDTASTFSLNMSKGLTGGATLAAGAGYTTAGTGSTGAYVKVSKAYSWLNTWAGLRKGWAADWSGFSAGTAFVAAVGASASVEF